ncbi:MAG: hypothetical protein ACE5JA_03360 [bacterium]
MKPLFSPLTLGYDWEMAVLKETMESAGDEEIIALSDRIRNALPWSRVGIDEDLLEARLGTVRSWVELVQKNVEYMREARRLAAKKKFLLLPIGARPTEESPIGSHIHTGTCSDLPRALALKNRMMRFVPVFVGMAANSPVYRFESGEYKSYRISTNADWCSDPQQPFHPRLCRGTWGEDVTVKVWWNNTIELRCCDSASDVNLMCELTVLAAGVMYALSKNLDIERMECSAEDVYWTAVNRWRAAKYGLQAKLMWNGEERPISEIARSMIDLAEEGMSILGASKNDLVVTRTMLKKRQTQADFVIAMQKCDPDPHRLLRTIASIYEEDNDAFKKYLEMASKLPVLEPMSIEEFLLSKITKEMSAFEVGIRTPLSPYDFDRLIEKMEAERKVKVDMDEQWGRRITRL